MEMTKKNSLGLLFFALSSAIGLSADDGYKNPLEVDVGSDAESKLSVSELEGKDAIVKKGAGTLVLPDLGNFDGDIVICEGVAKASQSGALGTAAGKTIVRGGGQLRINSPDLDFDFSKEPMEIASEGNSIAIYLNNNKTNKLNLGQIKLTSDAKIYIENQYELRNDVDLAGHTLTLSSRGPGTYLWLYKKFTAGHIVAEKIRCFLSSNVSFEGDAGNTFTLRTDSLLSLFQVVNAIPWKLKSAGKNATMEIRYKSGLKGEHNIYNGPIDLSDYDLSLTSGYKVGPSGVTLAGKISGSNSLRSSGAENYRDLTAFLTNPENDFTGGVTFNRGTLVLAVSGALPRDGGELQMQEGTLVLTNTNPYELPSATFDASGKVDGYAATGTWKDRLAKTGEGVFEYNTFVGANVLDIRGGTFKMPTEKIEVITNRIPGIYGGSKEYASGATAAWEGSETFTNDTYASPVMAYKAGTTQGWTANTLWTYSGYIWNRSPTNEMWTFASCILSNGKVLLDGECVVYNSSPASDQAWGGVKQGTVEVAPGPHTFEVRLLSGSVGTSTASGGGAYGFTTPLANSHGNEAGYIWGEGKGIMLDRLGRGSHNVADYEKIIDSGDGDLLTLTDAKDEVIHHLPVFETIVATNGAVTLDMNNNNCTYTLKNLVGTPTVVNCGQFLITDDWRLTDLCSAAAFEGAVEFAEGATLTLDLPEPPAGESEVEILSADRIAGLPTVVSDSTRGTWALSATESSLKLKWRPLGFRMIIR